MSTLKDRISEALAESGKTQTALATACGVKTPSVNDWLSGKTKSLKAVPAQRAAAFLGVNMLWLTEGRGPKFPGEPETFQNPPSDSQLAAVSAHSSNAPVITYEVVKGAVTGVLQALGIRYDDLIEDDEAARQRVEAALGAVADPADRRQDIDVEDRLARLGGKAIYDGKRVIPRQRGEPGRKKKPA